MKRGIIKFLIWFGIMIGLVIMSAMIWSLIFGNSQTVTALKWLQFLQTAGMFLLPPVICAWIWDEYHRPLRWLKMDRGTHWVHFILAFGIMIVALPAINLFADLNSLIPLPESMVQSELELEQTMKTFLAADNFADVIINIGLIALLPALAEELTFRGTLQQIISGSPAASRLRTHLAIWITAIIFSAIHLQFSGFIPRMLMGALFGYMFVWSGSLWIPILMHFANNAIVVILYQLLPENNNYADSIGAGTTWYIGMISLMLTCLGLLIFYRRTHRR